MVVVYISHQGCARSHAALRELNLINSWIKKCSPAISAVHRADYLTCHHLAQGEWALHPNIFNMICHRLGGADGYILASRFNN